MNPIDSVEESSFPDNVPESLPWDAELFSQAVDMQHVRTSWECRRMTLERSIDQIKQKKRSSVGGVPSEALQGQRIISISQRIAGSVNDNGMGLRIGAWIVLFDVVKRRDETEVVANCRVGREVWPRDGDFGALLQEAKGAGKGHGGTRGDA
jgi:hypothetical protein